MASATTRGRSTESGSEDGRRDAGAARGRRGALLPSAGRGRDPCRPLRVARICRHGAGLRTGGGPDCTAGKVVLPVPLKIAWEPAKTITSFRCHRLLAPAITSIFAAAVEHFGETRFRALKLDLFGGCFADRPMRGGSKKSVHAWGAALDVDPERNRLAWGRDRASLAAPDYEAWWRIVEAHGAVSLGRTENRDWMHFQFCRAR